MTEDYLNRFGGIARLYGIASLERFSKAHVMVIGLGGVGSWTIEALARSGVGQFTLVDLDDLCLTNTNRQIHATTDTIGRSKATVLAKRILQINPEARCSVEQTFYSEKNSEVLLSTTPDAVVDAIDSVRAKCHLLATCHEKNIPIITSGGAGGRIDAYQFDDLSRTFFRYVDGRSESDSAPNTAFQKPKKRLPNSKSRQFSHPNRPYFQLAMEKLPPPGPKKYPAG